MQDRFLLFLREKEYLKGVSPKTLKHYQTSWSAFLRYGGEFSPQGVKNFVINAKIAGVKTGAINSFSRGLNSFFSWLHENGHPEHWKIPMLQVEQKVLSTYCEAEARKVLSFKPKEFWEKRIFGILCLMIDTGCRIDEVITLRKEKVDMDNLLITFLGKGRKERVVPMSREVRAVLYRHLRSHSFELVFCTKEGLPVVSRS